MGVPSVCLCVGAILLITGLEAKSLKLVPSGTKTIHSNGATHEISRYILVPDDGASNDTSNNATEKKTFETLNDAKDDNVDHDQKHNMSPKPAETDTEDSKLTDTTIAGKNFKVKYSLVNVARPVADINQNVKVDEATKTFKGYSQFGAEVETNETANSSSEETAGDQNSFGHIQTKTITKTIYNPTKITNIKFNELPIKWHDNENGLNPLVSSIPINKTFTLPGKRGRFKLLHEDDEDMETVIKHSTTYPKTQTRTHYYSDKYYLDDSEKIIPDLVNTDSSFKSVTIKTYGQSGESKPSLIKTYLSTNNEKDGKEITSGKYHLRSSPSSNSFIEVNKPFSFYTNMGDSKYHTDSSINMIENQKLPNDTNVVNISVQKVGKETTPKKTITVSSFVSKSDIEQMKPKLQYTTSLGTKSASKIDSINESIPPNDDHAKSNVDGTHFSTNRFELVTTQDNSETYSQLKNKYVDETSNEHKILKIAKISPESKDALRVIPLENKLSEITNVLQNEKVTLPTINTSSTKTNFIITNGMKHNESSSDIKRKENNDDMSVPKLVSLIGKFENTHNKIGIVTSNPHEVTKTFDEVNVPTMESQTNTIELVPTVDTSNTIITKGKPSFRISNIMLSKDHNKVTTPKLDLPINNVEIIPAEDRTTIDNNYENQNKLLSTDGINISSVENQNEVTVNSDPLNIEITPTIYKTYEKPKIGTEYGNEYVNKTVIVPTEKETNRTITMVENEFPTNGVKPKQNYEDVLNNLGTRHGNNHEIETKDTKTIHFSGRENLRISSISPIHKNVVQLTDSPNSKYEITMDSEVADADEHKISASNTENNQRLSQYKTNNIITEANSDNRPEFDIYSSDRAELENKKSNGVESITDHTNILTLFRNEKTPIVPPLKHIDVFTNILPEINTELTPLEIKQEEPKPHAHCHEMNYKGNNPTNENENSIPDLNNDEIIKFRLGKHHTNLPATNSEEIDDLVSNNWKSKITNGIEENPMQFEYVSASKTPDVDSNDSEVTEHLKSEEYPFEKEKSRSSRITNKEATTENDDERFDKNINQYAFVGNKKYQPIEQPRRSNSYYNVADNYPLHTIGYVQLHPYQVYGGYHTHDNFNPNYENARLRNTQVNNEQYLQYILNYLISSNLISEINAKYASAGQGVDKDEIIMQAIVANLQKLGIYNQIGQEQLHFLTQQIKQNEMINIQKNINHKVEIIYEIDDKPTVIALPNQDVPHQYYIVPYANKERMNGVATNPNIRLLQDEAYLQRYLLEGFDVSTVNFATVGDLSSRILEFVKYLRSLRVPHYQILQFIGEVKKHLTMEVLLTFMTECKSKAFVGLSERIDLVSKQFLQNYMLTSYPIQYT